MSPIRVLHAPTYPKNPYQRLLADALASHDIEVMGTEAVGIDRPEFMPTVEEWGPDVVHLHWLHPYFRADDPDEVDERADKLLRDLDSLKERGVRLVWTAHNLKNHEGVSLDTDKRVTRGVVERVDTVIAHGRRARRRIVSHCGDTARGKIEVIPMGNYAEAYPSTLSREEAREELGIERDRFVYLFLGRIRPYKGVFELIRLFRKQKLPDDSLLVIAGKAGDSDSRLKLKSKCRNQEQIRLDYGHVPDERMAVYGAAADVAVLPYRNILSTSATVLNMSFGLPIVAPKIDCILDIAPLNGALLYNHRFGRGLQQAMRRAHRRKRRIKDMGEENLNAMLSWPWSRVAELTANTYR